MIIWYKKCNQIPAIYGTISQNRENQFSALHEKCPYSEFFWSPFSRILLYSVRMWKNKDQKNSKYGHFSRSADSF